eukprot:FR742039.1.p1 GENE.FR742039.1~~FR742039.1.p1  ORF type:complete len:162 (+),score=18.45 FR742039.1:66-488(+)
MHEATRRLLSVVLQRVEGLEGTSKSTLICATNRRQDLDPALLSRFDPQLRFQLPNQRARRAIFERYAKQLSDEEKNTFARAATGLSCRDIKETCEHAERRWVAALIRKDVTTPDTPPISEYMFCLAHRRRDDSANADLAV